MSIAEQVSSIFTKALATSATDTSFASKIPTGTEPSGDGVHNRGSGHNERYVMVVPYGIGNDDHTFDMRIIGWYRVASDVNSLLWIPVILTQVAVTLSTAVGVAGKTIIATERFADTISLTTGNDDIDQSITSPTGNVIAHFVCDTKGAEKIEFTFDKGSGTDCNALFKYL